MTHPNQVVREAVLCILYGLDIGGAQPGHDLTSRIERGRTLLKEVQPRFEGTDEAVARRIEAIFDEWEAINEGIQSVSPNWRVERMSIVDRNILRMACWELEHGDVPPAVIIDSSVELGKSYGATETSSFVNGLLEEYCSTRDIVVS